MRALLFLLLLVAPALPTPSYFASVANQALRLRGGAALGPDLSVQAVKMLEVQVFPAAVLFLGRRDPDFGGRGR
jgi:hypothetical protein